MKRYIISRRSDMTVTCNVAQEGGGYPLPHMIRHSPTGFECGYHGSGPSDLALSILTDVIGREAAEAAGLYHRFKAEFIAGLQIEPGESAGIDEDVIRGWLAGAREPEARRVAEGGANGD